MSDLLQDTRLAVELEEKGYAFYREIAGKTANPLAKSTLSSLADRELVHIERIKEVYKSLSGKKKLSDKWLKTVDFPPTKEALIKPICLKLKESLNKQIGTKEEANKAYEIAEGLERDSFELYERISKEANDGTIKKFYSALAFEEREHFAILEDTLKYLDDPGEWYRLQERWIVEG